MSDLYQLTGEDRELFVQVRELVRKNASDFATAGAWIDDFGNAASRRHIEAQTLKELKRQSHYSPKRKTHQKVAPRPVPYENILASAFNSLLTDKQILADRASDDSRETVARRVILVTWLLTYPDAHLFETPLTIVQSGEWKEIPSLDNSFSVHSYNIHQECSGKEVSFNRWLLRRTFIEKSVTTANQWIDRVRQALVVIHGLNSICIRTCEDLQGDLCRLADRLDANAKQPSARRASGNYDRELEYAGMLIAQAIRQDYLNLSDKNGMWQKDKAKWLNSAAQRDCMRSRSQGEGSSIAASGHFSLFASVSVRLSRQGRIILPSSANFGSLNTTPYQNDMVGYIDYWRERFGVAAAACREIARTMRNADVLSEYGLGKTTGAIGVKKLNGKAMGKKGRPKRYDYNESARLWSHWQGAKASGTQLKEFVQQRGLNFKELKKRFTALRAYRQRNDTD